MTRSLREFADEPALSEFLDELNDSGECPEVAAVDAFAIPFLAAITDLDGLVEYATLDYDGRPHGRVDCDECGSEATDWHPTYPVVVIVTDEVTK